MSAILNFKQLRLAEPIKRHLSPHLLEPDNALNAPFQLRTGVRFLTGDFLAGKFIGIEFWDLCENPIPTLNLLYQTNQIV